MVSDADAQPQEARDLRLIAAPFEDALVGRKEEAELGSGFELARLSPQIVKDGKEEPIGRNAIANIDGIAEEVEKLEEETKQTIKWEEGMG